MPPMRVLFTSTAGWGHINPMVPLAKALLDGGDEVLWATAANAAARLEGEGIATTPAGMDGAAGMAEFFRTYPELLPLPPTDRADLIFSGLFGHVLAPPMLADLMPVATSWKPSLVVCDAAEFAGPIAAVALGVANVTHSYGTLIPAPRVAATGEEVAPLWKEHDLDPRPYGGCYDHLYLDIYPPTLQHDERPLVTSTQRLRPSSYATPGDEAIPSLVTAPSPDPLLYVTFGTLPTGDAALAAVVAAVSTLSVRVVVTVGPRRDPASLGPQPPNVHVARYIPQEQLLPHCSAVISHGGSGTFLAAIGAGLPQLCVPQGADQFRNAAACTVSGAGLALRPGSDSDEQIRTAVDRLLTEGSFRASAERVSQEIAGMPSPRAVADRLRADYG